jgi:predicted acylesterase/phospholipase RssA
MAQFDIVFEGGGAKGSAFVGALTALKAAGHTPRRLVGTSAGAITAALSAVGYSADEMLAAVNEKLPNGKPRFSTFLDHPHASDFSAAQRSASDTMRALRMLHIPMMADEVVLKLLLETPVYPTLFSFVECGGVFAGVAFLEWLREKLALKHIAADATLAQVHQATGVDLSLVASDTTDMEMLVLNHVTAPAVPLAWAVRMSMSIPLVWREVVWQEGWGTYAGRAKTGNIIVDGGVLSNFPIRLIDERMPGLMDDSVDPEGALNLGLLLDEELAVPGVDVRKPPISTDDLRVVQRLSRLMDTMMRARDNEQMRSHAAEVCRLPVRGYGTTEFSMEERKLKALIDTGHAAVVNHLASRNLAGAAKA